MNAAAGHRVLQRLARAVEHQMRADALCLRQHMVEEADRHARRKAAAEHQIARQGLERGDGIQAGLLLGRRQRRAGQDEAVLQTAAGLVDGEAFAGIAGDRHADLRQAQPRQHALEHVAERPAGRVDRHGLAAEGLDHPRHVDAAAARIVVRQGTAQLAGRLDPRGAGREIHRRIQGQGGNTGHGGLQTVRPADRQRQQGVRSS
ncbi:hypothetical protein D3C78_1318760 [compost metagenome]